MKDKQNIIQTDLVGRYEAKRPSFFRRLSMESFEVIPSGHNMIALLELDVTDVRHNLRELKRKGSKVSLFAYIIKSIAKALSEYPELNVVKSRTKIYKFNNVDINIPVELNTKGEKFPRQITIRNSANKTIEEIYFEIETSKENFRNSGNAGVEDKKALAMMRLLFFIPKLFRRLVLKIMINRPLLVKKMSGTTFITAVGMFGNIPGFAIPYMGGPRAVSFALGSIVKKPAVIVNEILVREFLSMTICFNHDLVDGAPAARFTNRLKKVIECREILK